MKVLFGTHIWFESLDRGFYHFCKNLSEELLALLGSDCFGIYGIKEGRSLFPDDIDYVLKRRIHKYWLWLSSGYSIWHASSQVDTVYPKSAQKILLTVHDLNFLHEPGCTDDRQLCEIEKLQRKINHADEIVAISQFTKKDIERYCDLKGKRLSVVYNGCSL